MEVRGSGRGGDSRTTLGDMLPCGGGSGGGALGKGGGTTVLVLREQG